MTAALKTNTFTTDGKRFTVTNRRPSVHFNTLATVDVLDADGTRIAEASVTYAGEAQLHRHGWAKDFLDLDFWDGFRATLGAAVVDGAGTAEPASAPKLKAFRVKGTTDDVTTCEQCGRQDLKYTVALAFLDADGNEEEITYMGSDCAARAAGWTQGEVRTAARRADREARDRAVAEADRRRQAERAEFEAAFSDWLLETHGTRDEDAVIKKLGILIRFPLIQEFRASRKG